MKVLRLCTCFRELLSQHGELLHVVSQGYRLQPADTSTHQNQHGATCFELPLKKFEINIFELNQTEIL